MTVALAAAGGELFRAIGEDVGRLRHEVDAAENDPAALAVGRRQGAELVAVAAEVRQGDDVVLLVVVAEDQEPSAQITANFLDMRGKFIAVQRFVRAEVERGGSHIGGGQVKTCSVAASGCILFSFRCLAGTCSAPKGRNIPAQGKRSVALG